jgi:copper chaperone CopZ
MHCGGCANALKGKIVALSGVSSCDVSFDDSKAVVVADPAQTDAIEGAITGLGYTATAQQ